jgi:alpha-glucosidase (family GH31 glycosyl hydrolase)
LSVILQSLETDTGVIIRTSHSELTFTIWQSGFELRRAGDLILRSGPGWGTPANSVNQWAIEGDQIILTYIRGTHGMGRLVVTALDNGWRFTWDQPTRDTFSLASGNHWYGHGALIHQDWPLETLSLWEAPLMTWDNGPTGLGNIQEPLWVTATGVAIYVENATPSLHVGLNAPPLTLAPPQWDLTANAAPFISRPPSASTGATGLLALVDRRAPLTYLLLVGEDVVDAHRQAIKVIGKPDNAPHEGLLRAPIWTTWARYKTHITQETVINFAREIRAHGFPGGTLEIDDKWQQHYGDNALDPQRFPDPRRMVATLNDLGFAVTLWVIPFFDAASKNAQDAIRHNYVVRRPDGKHYDVPWWQGTAHLLDVSNPYALDWWADKLRKLQQSLGLAGFKFDAGEANYLPADAQLFMAINRNDYSARWAQFGATQFPYGEVRCGWHSQRLAILFRQWDKASTWGLDNGLASVITGALALGMVGYPFVLPDMIGGNAYHGQNADKELLIRWTQASAPMLAIQFSLAPWDYDPETVDICRKYATLHVDLLPERLRAARQATESGTPVIRPLFWANPHDAQALTTRDQYLLGESHLVAPVIVRGATSRDVYLPSGTWRDYWTGRVYDGGQWLHGFPAPLDTLPLFVKQQA